MRILFYVYPFQSHVNPWPIHVNPWPARTTTVRTTFVITPSKSTYLTMCYHSKGRERHRRYGCLAFLCGLRLSQPLLGATRHKYKLYRQRVFECRGDLLVPQTGHLDAVQDSRVARSYSSAWFINGQQTALGVHDNCHQSFHHTLLLSARVRQYIPLVHAAGQRDRHAGQVQAAAPFHYSSPAVSTLCVHVRRARRCLRRSVFCHHHSATLREFDARQLHIRQRSHGSRKGSIENAPVGSEAEDVHIEHPSSLAL
mmetsp:Transcript_1632/g.2812  ORF Transcript_1632/g.2812 Transcript_1632/m.2812 type:complete len:255 (+) Transcript_1632:326-1090(+)